jgi:hypothetical protein
MCVGFSGAVQGLDVDYVLGDDTARRNTALRALDALPHKEVLHLEAA